MDTTTQEPATVVIFRVINNEVIALFPEEPASYKPGEITCYQHIGQHSGASVALFREGRLATPEEYATLKEELEEIGYIVKIRQRKSAKNHDIYLKNFYAQFTR